MRSFGQLWPTLKRLLAYGSPWRKPLGVAVIMLWVASTAEVSGPRPRHQPGRRTSGAVMPVT